MTATKLTPGEAAGYGGYLVTEEDYNDLGDRYDALKFVLLNLCDTIINIAATKEAKANIAPAVLRMVDAARQEAKRG